MYEIKNTEDFVIRNDNHEKFDSYRKSSKTFDDAIKKRNEEIYGFIFGNDGHSFSVESMDFEIKALVMYKDNTFICLTEKYVVEGTSKEIKDYVKKYGRLV